MVRQSKRGSGDDALALDLRDFTGWEPRGTGRVVTRRNLSERAAVGPALHRFELVEKLPAVAGAAIFRGEPS